MHRLVSSEFSNSITIGSSSQAQWVRIANKVWSVAMTPSSVRRRHLQQSLSVCLVLFECILRAQFMISRCGRSTRGPSVATPLLNSSPLQGGGDSVRRGWVRVFHMPTAHRAAGVLWQICNGKERVTAFRLLDLAAARSHSRNLAILG